MSALTYTPVRSADSVSRHPARVPPGPLRALALAAGGLLVAGALGASEIAQTVEASLAALLLVVAWDQRVGSPLLTGPLPRHTLVRLSLGTLAAYLATVAIDRGLGQRPSAVAVVLLAGSTLAVMVALGRSRDESKRPEPASNDSRPTTSTDGGKLMSNVITLSEGNFQSEVLDSELPVLIDYWAPWCGPCRVAGPIVEQIAAEYAGRLKVGKVNVDDEPRLAREAGVLSIPYLVLYRDGEPVESIAGAYPKPVLEEVLGLDGARPQAA